MDGVIHFTGVIPSGIVPEFKADVLIRNSGANDEHKPMNGIVGNGGFCFSSGFTVFTVEGSFFIYGRNNKTIGDTGTYIILEIIICEAVFKSIQQC